MSAPGDPPIIIQGGGSITISFNEGAFLEVASGNFASVSLNVNRVEVIVNGSTVLDETIKDGDVTTVNVYYG